MVVDLVIELFAPVHIVEDQAYIVFDVFVPFVEVFELEEVFPDPVDPQTVAPVDII